VQYTVEWIRLGINGIDDGMDDDGEEVRFSLIYRIHNFQQIFLPVTVGIKTLIPTAT
jgi:hypothetical protein